MGLNSVYVFNKRCVNNFSNESSTYPQYVKISRELSVIATVIWGDAV